MVTIYIFPDQYPPTPWYSWWLFIHIYTINNLLPQEFGYFHWRIHQKISFLQQSLQMKDSCIYAIFPLESHQSDQQNTASLLLCFTIYIYCVCFNVYCVCFMYVSLVCIWFNCVYVPTTYLFRTTNISTTTSSCLSIHHIHLHCIGFDSIRFRCIAVFLKWGIWVKPQFIFLIFYKFILICNDN